MTLSLRQVLRLGSHQLLRSASLCVLLVAASSASAVEPGEALADPGLESRARRLSAEFRCLVCQNQSIDDSDAPLARDLRLLVRDRLKAGDSDGQVTDYVVGRYGEFVLLRPVLGVHTALLWLGPVVIVGAAALGIALARRRQREPAEPGALTRDEQDRLSAVLGPGPG